MCSFDVRPLSHTTLFTDLGIVGLLTARKTNHKKLASLESQFSVDQSSATGVVENRPKRLPLSEDVLNLIRRVGKKGDLELVEDEGNHHLNQIIANMTCHHIIPPEPGLMIDGICSDSAGLCMERECLFTCIYHLATFG